MASVYNDNVAQADVVHIWDGQTVENVLYFFYTNPINEAGLLNLATGLRDYWQTNMLPLMSSLVAFQYVEVTHLTPSPAYTATVPANSPNVGGDSNPASPNNVSITVSFRTGVTGRSYRGRNYWLGLTEPNVINSSVNPAHAALIVDAYAGMTGPDTIATDWRWGVYSRYVNGVPRETGQFTDITTVLITDYVVDSQRRRLPGRGR